MTTIKEPTYDTFAAFYTALQSGKIDRDTLELHIDCGDFYIVDENNHELVEGDERDLLLYLSTLLGIVNGVVNESE